MHEGLRIEPGSDVIDANGQRVGTVLSVEGGIMRMAFHDAGVSPSLPIRVNGIARVDADGVHLAGPVSQDLGGEGDEDGSGIDLNPAALNALHRGQARSAP
ncbi:DUF2171 domain-containing protein [Sphingobium lignivorans]|uniref:DUF2171 domain-containing protein n=1 Tax=Sphingobium lignivorans TaxID=2735886 RepID=A0ABR6NE19_9SPHN|nr:DUF2171 domain-containing protein [Sphingobium lignivorans]MBB5984474.1 hypothetical protein [Sphingobium lignivorans]